jgi:hypothetical protein
MQPQEHGDLAMVKEDYEADESVER